MFSFLHAFPWVLQLPPTVKQRCCRGEFLASNYYDQCENKFEWLFVFLCVDPMLKWQDIRGVIRLSPTVKQDGLQHSQWPWKRMSSYIKLIYGLSYWQCAVITELFTVQCSHTKVSPCSKWWFNKLQPSTVDSSIKTYSSPHAFEHEQYLEDWQCHR